MTDIHLLEDSLTTYTVAKLNIHMSLLKTH